MWIKGEGYYFNSNHIVAIYAYDSSIKTKDAKWLIDIVFKDGQPITIPEEFTSLYLANEAIKEIIGKIDNAEKLMDIAEGKFRPSNPAGKR